MSEHYLFKAPGVDPSVAFPQGTTKGPASGIDRSRRLTIGRLMGWSVGLSLGSSIGLGLSGCATVPANQTIGVEPGPDPHSSATSPSARFERQGRFSMRWTTHLSGRSEQVQGGFVWQEQDPQLRLTLLSPVNTLMALLTLGPEGASLQTPDAPLQTAADADSLFEPLLGWRLPVTGLQQWLHGKTTDGQVHFPVASQLPATPMQLADQGWRVVLSAFDSLGPTTLDAKFSNADLEIACRLVCLTQTSA